MCTAEKANFNVDFSVHLDISDAEPLEMAVINAIWYLVSDIIF